MAAGRARFAEMLQQHHAAAIGGFAHAEHGVELLQFDVFLHLFAGALLNAFAQNHPVIEPVAEPAGGRQAVAAGAAGFLIEMLHALRHVQMRHKAHIGLVDAHAESHRGHHNHAVVAGEAALVGFARFHA